MTMSVPSTGRRVRRERAVGNGPIEYEDVCAYCNRRERELHDQDVHPKKSRLGIAQLILDAHRAFYRSLLERREPVTPAMDSYACWLRILVLRHGFTMETLGATSYLLSDIPNKSRLDRVCEKLASPKASSSSPKKFKAAFGVSAVAHKKLLRKMWSKREFE
jgi:hypothetical protein